MKISIRHLTYGDIQDRMDWLDKNVGPRKYVLHNQTGGVGWRYYSNERTIEIEDERWELMYMIKFGG
jgi:hypothetical protein